jgi:hypothetical protein
LPRVSSRIVPDRGWAQIYLGIALTTLATLVLELSLTRVFSVIFYYHFAFLAISIALFGLGAGGVFSYLIAGWRGNFYWKLGALAALNSIVVLASLIFLITRTGEPGGWMLVLVYFASALPFFISGTIVSLTVAETIAKIDRVYFFDLLGAAGGCLVLVPFLNYWGGPNTVLAASIFFAVSASIWLNLAGSFGGRASAVALALILVVLLIYNGKANAIDMHYAKGQRIPPEDFIRWNSFSRIGVRNVDGIKEVVIDGDASTGIANFDLDNLSVSDRRQLLHQGPGLAYDIRPAAKTLIIGPGGGWDVSRAIASGSKDVTAVEINPIIAETVMKKQFAAYTRGLYFRPEVHLYVEDGRSFVRHSNDRYQLLQATLVDTWASTAAGAFALSENNLYTTDAFTDYLSHLTDDGLLVFTRWGFDPPRESLRLVSLAMTALPRLGETDAKSHVLVFREDAARLKGWGAQDTVMIFRKPISADDLTRARAAIEGTGIQLIYSPGLPLNETAFSQLLNSPDTQAFLDKYPFDVSAVGDDRPFFFYTVQPQDVWAFLKGPTVAADYKVNRALPLLFGAVAVSLLATIVVLALPPLFLGTRLPADRGVRRSLLYFAAIGAGYILIQIGLIQKFVLLLGHPTYALTVIVFSMLVASGLGSLFSRRIVPGESDLPLRWVLAGIAAAIITLAFVITPLSEIVIGWPLPLKMLITALLIAPAAFLMGMPFPAGLSRLEAGYPDAVRWAWSLNAAASVLGSCGAIVLSIYLGLRATLLIGGGLYLGALLVVWLQRRIPDPLATPEKVGAFSQ